MIDVTTDFENANRFETLKYSAFYSNKNIQISQELAILQLVYKRIPTSQTAEIFTQISMIDVTSDFETANRFEILKRFRF